MKDSWDKISRSDFSDKENPKYEKVNFSFHDYGHHLVIVNTGKGHADLSQEYSEIPMEMREAAKAAGAELLCETTLEDVLAHMSEIENDRAILRAIHVIHRHFDSMPKSYDSLFTPFSVKIEVSNFNGRRWSD